MNTHNKTVSIGIVFLVMLALARLPARPAYAATITVNTTSDVLDAAATCGAVTVASLPGPDGVTSLREAMCAANNNVGSDTIEFNITGCGGVCTIQPTIALPILTGDGTIIDGYTQPGTVLAVETTPATLKIEIDGTNVANNNGFNILSGGNVISGVVINRFGWDGIYIGGSGATGNVIAGNYIGANAGGTADLGNGLDGVYIGEGARSNTVGGDVDAERNVLSGNGWEGVGIHGSGTLSNTVSGNYIGTDAGGTAALGNTLDGVRIYGGAKNNTVGGDIAEVPSGGERNVISGNGEHGVRIEGSGTTGNIVSGNYIGTTAGGMAPMPNESGILIAGGARHNLIGGNMGTERNVISGNQDHGIRIRDAGTIGNLVFGNLIGTNATGTAALGNASCGVCLDDGASESVVGLNLVSANLVGVCMSGTTTMSNTISANLIGTDTTGHSPLGNTLAGVYLMSGARRNTVGGAYPGWNFISGNGGSGVIISGTGTVSNTILGNMIGVAASGLTLVGNGGNGVLIAAGARDNTIGPENFVVGSALDGVAVDGGDTDGNRIARNHIFSNTMGIHLLGGANGGIAAPVITATMGSDLVAIEGTACAGCTVEVFANLNADGEGEVYLGSAVAAGGNFSLTGDSHGAHYLTATATDAADGTSEFSAVYTIPYRVYLPVVVR